MKRADDRTVHARYDNMEIVRYDRQGHWYFEPQLFGLKRQKTDLKGAVGNAIWGEKYANGVVYLDLPGGQRFDADYRKRKKAEAA